MKITIIHNVYTKNPFIKETIKLNLLALKYAKIDYQYIVFNDNGNLDIIFDIPKSKYYNIFYFRSPINYGKKKCTGGWVGSEKENLINGDIIHNIGQDDIMSSLFYQEAKKCFENKENWFFTSNGFKVNEQLELLNIMINPNFNIDYSLPLKHFKMWFGIQYNKVTSANNGMLASGTMYRRDLHNLIGMPDLDKFEGAADFEYWSRILFNEYKGKYLSMPSWYYRQSKYSTGNEIIDGIINRGTKENPGHQQLAIGRIKNNYTEYVKNDNRFKL